MDALFHLAIELFHVCTSEAQGKQHQPDAVQICVISARHQVKQGHCRDAADTEQHKAADDPPGLQIAAPPLPHAEAEHRPHGAHQQRMADDQGAVRLFPAQKIAHQHHQQVQHLRQAQGVQDPALTTQHLPDI